MSLSRNQIKWITSLQIKKFRQKYHKFLAEGDKIVRELLENPEWNTTELYALDTWIRDYGAGLAPETVFPVTEDESGAGSGLANKNET